MKHDHSIVVIEKPIPRYATGIMDQFGNQIFRSPVKHPIGFVWFYEKTEVAEAGSETVL